MSARIDRCWTVFKSVENDEHNRCVDFFSRPDGTFGFEEFRRDVEDQGRWTPVGYYSGMSYASSADALVAARRAIVWFLPPGAEGPDAAVQPGHEQVEPPGNDV